MISNHHTRRLDLRWLSRPLKIDWDELLASAGADIGFAATQATNDPGLRNFDEALEQMVPEECRVCPLCGAHLDLDETVAIRNESDPNLVTIPEEGSMTMHRLSRWKP
jgi:hypothetical protein